MYVPLPPGTGWYICSTTMATRGEAAEGEGVVEGERHMTLRVRAGCVPQHCASFPR